MNENLPVFGPVEVFGGVDELEPAVAVVQVAFALTRTQLVTALGIGFAGLGADRTPESLTDAEVLLEVEHTLATEAIVELDRQIEADEARVFPPEQQRAMDILAAAIDRVYRPATVGEEKSPDLDSFPAPPVQQPRYGDGTVTLQTLDHGEITISEPRWCTGHDGEQIVQRVDVAHVGATVAAEYAGVEFLPARISWGPFAELRPEPYPLADVDEFPSMEPDELRELAAEVGLHAGRLYSKANELDRIRRGQS